MAARDAWVAVLGITTAAAATAASSSSAAAAAKATTEMAPTSTVSVSLDSFALESGTGRAATTAEQLPDSVATPTAAAAGPEPNLTGVSAAFLRKFVEDATAALGAGDFTTKDACDAVVVPRTRPQMCAYVDLYEGQLDVSGRPYLAPATVFISHAWKYPLDTPVSVMLQHAEANPNAYCWFDLFVNNQVRHWGAWWCLYAFVHLGGAHPCICNHLVCGVLFAQRHLPPRQICIRLTTFVVAIVHTFVVHAQHPHTTAVRA